LIRINFRKRISKKNE